MVFVRQLDRSGAAAVDALRQVFGFTEAEASLAQALQAGMSIADYARDRRVGVNTVYTHLRGVKDKTGCNRMGALIRRLSAVELPWRAPSDWRRPE
jgi:DNA-binding CsgD family transcriptional regulator